MTTLVGAVCVLAMVVIVISMAMKQETITPPEELSFHDALVITESEYEERIETGEGLHIVERWTEDTPDGPLTTVVCVKD